MHLLRTADDLAPFEGGSFVATMGALHEGHLALARHAGQCNRPLVVSIFVNPTQFGPDEDEDRYPRTLEADLAAARDAGVDAVFAPAADVIYPLEETIPVPRLPGVASRPALEDRFRPGHFAGVCQVVSRLFDLVRPGVTVFGEKDYQQLRVITELVEQEGDRWPGLRVEPHPIVREPDGLARSSRNRYLDDDRRAAAGVLSRALEAGRAAISAPGPGAVAGIEQIMAAEQIMVDEIASTGFNIDYAVVRDAAHLEPLERIGGPARALVAARLGDIRLIDNMAVPAGFSKSERT